MILISCLVFLVINGCIEPYEGDVPDYEDILIVSANLTNEFKRQEVLLTRSYRFEEDGARAELNAQVKIMGGDGSEFLFEETEPGQYLSNITFAASPGIEYWLTITTEGGREYISDAMSLPSVATMGELYAEPMIDENGDEGIGIFVDSFDPEGDSRYYRFDYEETYKIIAPFWTPYDVVVLIEGEAQPYLAVILREREEQICYGTDTPSNIIIQSTLGLTEDRLNRFNVRFIRKRDYKLTHRYSILVKQFVQNPKAYAFYETLEGLSKTSENIFSEDQPGFLSGNIEALDGSGENVAGFFEVSTVDEQRIFFNFEDFFPGEEKPPYKVTCELVAPTEEGELGKRPLVNAIYADRLKFYDINMNPTESLPGPYFMVRSECGDCTVLGSNKVPDFWVE